MGDVDLGGGRLRLPARGGMLALSGCSARWGRVRTRTSPPNGNVGAPIRMAAEMNREAEGNMYQADLHRLPFQRLGGRTPRRAATGLYNNPTLSTNVAPNSDTPNQCRLAQLIGTKSTPTWSGHRVAAAWKSRGQQSRRQYHLCPHRLCVRRDQQQHDPKRVRRDHYRSRLPRRRLRYACCCAIPKARNWIARSVYHGVVRYMNQFDALPLNFLPEPPVNVRAVATNNAISLSWSAPVAAGQQRCGHQLRRLSFHRWLRLRQPDQHGRRWRNVT